MNHRMSAGLGVIAAASLFSLSRIFSGTSWLLPVFGAAGTALAILIALRALGMSGWGRFPIAALMAGLVIGLLVVPDSVPQGGLIPSPARLWDVARRAIEESLVVSVPVLPSSGFLLLAAAGAWAAVLLSEQILFLGHPLIASFPWFGLFAYTSGTAPPDGRQLSVAVFAAGLIAYLLLVGSPSSSSYKPAPLHGLGGATVLGAIAVIGAVSLPQILPGYESDAVLALDIGPRLRTEISPIVQIRPRLDETPEVRVFTVRSNLPPPGSPLYWRLLALDDYSQEAWHSSADYSPVKDANLAYPYRGKFTRLQQSVAIQGLGGPWIPVSYQVRNIEGIRASLDPLSAALIRTTGELEPGDEYQAVSRLPNPTVEDLVSAPAAAGLAKYTELPPLDPRVIQIANALTSNERNQYRKVMAVVNHLRQFEYNEDVSPGHSPDRLLQFLTETQAGYCEQFAGATGVLLRAIGIPARVAVGFLPGNYDATEGAFSVTTRFAHAWPEVYFEGIGWVPFEPTPRSIASPPSYASDANGDSPAPETPEVVEEVPVPEEPQLPEEAAPLLDPQIPEASSSTPIIAIVVAGVALTALITLVALILLKRLARRRRYSAATTASGVARAAFFEVEAAAVDLDRGRRLNETPAEFAESICRQMKLGSARELIVAFEKAEFREGGPEDSEAEEARKLAAQLARQMWTQAGWKGKATLLASPRSLVSLRGRR